MSVKEPRSYYGASALRAWWSGYRDRRAGRSHQANARWGWLRAPGGRGPALWVQATGEADDVLLAAELTRAIREKRLDLRVILTFERDYPELLDPRIGGLKGVGYGFGPCDHPRAIRRTLARLDPLRTMTIGRGPAANLARQSAARQLPAVVIAGDPATDFLPMPLEAVYPVDERQARRWRQLGAEAAQVQAPVDFLTLLTTAQVDPNFRRLICGNAELDLWWLHGVPAMQAQHWVAAWRAAGLDRAGVLFLGLEGHLAGQAWPALSAWTREPVPAGSVLLVDEAKWLPAIAAASTGAHLSRAGRGVAWQAMAGGKPVSVADVGQYPVSQLQDAPDAPAVLPDASAVMQAWQSYLENPIRARLLGDAARRFFWEERRKAQARLPELLQRVFDW